jgi:hypothetical protein
LVNTDWDVQAVQIKSAKRGRHRRCWWGSAKSCQKSKIASRGRRDCRWTWVTAEA